VAATSVVAGVIGWTAIRRVIPPPGQAPIIVGTEGIIRQRATTDCGIAVLAMLFHRLGRGVGADHLWQTVQVPRGGLTLPELAALSARHGVALVPVVSSTKTPDGLVGPWIAHLTWNHFVLVESTSNAHIVVADPRGMRVAYPRAVFRRAWSGFGLRLADGVSSYEARSGGMGREPVTSTAGRQVEGPAARLRSLVEHAWVW